MDSNLYEGRCVGGPLDGRDAESRFPKGFIYVDVPGERVWVYDYREESPSVPAAFIAREVDNLSRPKAEKAAAGSTYDVRAYDDGEIPEGLEVGL